MKRRKCIFTGNPANTKLTITSDNHNWAKDVPCTKKYLSGRTNKELSELEIRLVELFYQQELARTRVEHYEAQMAEIRPLMGKKLPIEPLKKPEIYKNVELTQEDTDWPNAPMGPLENTEKEVEKVDFQQLKGENHIKQPETEWEPEECPNPDCPSMLQNAPGIGPFCPNKDCDVGDGPNVWKKPDKVLTEEKKDVKVEKVEKKVVKKKPLSNIWD